MKDARLISRRGVIGVLGAGLAFGAKAEAADFDLAYRAGELSWPGGRTRAACGKAGVSPSKHEGDLTTPAGAFPLTEVFYRADRLPKPTSGLPVRALEPADAWIDDPADPGYNSATKLPCAAHVEHLWRQDQLYDLLVVIAYNVNPVRAFAGSAVFLHVARPGYPGTAGCIAVGREALVGLVAQLTRDSRIAIYA